MTSLLLLRHGPTVWNREKRFQGRTDIPLSEEGRELVRSWQLPQAWHQVRWISSPLDRARETAALLGHPEAEVESLLIETDWGEWEGERLPDLRARLGEEMAAMEAQGLDLLPPGGESPRLLQKRLRPLLERLAKQGEPIVAVAHKGVLRALYAQASGWDMRGKPPEKLRDSCAHLFHLSSTGEVSAVQANLSLLSDQQDFPLPPRGTAPSGDPA